MSRPRTEWLSEDYLVFTATSLDDVRTADELLAAHGAKVAHAVREATDSAARRTRAGYRNVMRPS